MRKWNQWRNGLNRWFTNNDPMPFLRSPVFKVIALNTAVFVYECAIVAAVEVR